MRGRFELRENNLYYYSNKKDTNYTYIDYIIFEKFVGFSCGIAFASRITAFYYNCGKKIFCEVIKYIQQLMNEGEDLANDGNETSIVLISLTNKEVAKALIECGCEQVSDYIYNVNSGNDIAVFMLKRTEFPPVKELSEDEIMESNEDYWK
jgi:hypothetical protein